MKEEKITIKLLSLFKKNSNTNRTKGNVSIQFSIVTVCLLFLLPLTAPAWAGDLIWYEDFDNLSDGVTLHAGEAAWERDLQGTDVQGYFEVKGHKYEANYLTGQVKWASENINIKYYKNVDIQVDLASAGDLESDDDLNVYYRVDGGSAILLQNGSQNGKFSPVTATASGISGQTLQIIAVFRNTGGSEKYSIDNISVTGDPIAVPGNVVWNETFTDLPDGTQGDNGNSAWDRDISATAMSSVGYFEIRQSRLLGRDLRGEAVWTSEAIDISAYPSVNISADISSYGRLENSDYIRVYYKLDGGPETLLTNGEINGKGGSPITAYRNGLSGSTIQIVARMLNTYEDERHVLDNIIVKSNGAQYVLWYEDFDNLPDGVTLHAGQAAWDRDTQGADISGHFQVSDHRYEAHHVNSEVLWVSEPIGIRYFQNVGIRADLASAGVLESNDYMDVYYRVNNGPLVELQNASHTGNFAPVTATASGISGDTLQIIAKFRNGADGEKYTIDNVYVTAESFAPPGDLIWHESFNDLADYATQDSGDSAWSTDISATSMIGTGYFEVHQLRLLGRDLRGEAVWTSEVIDIASHPSVDISADISGYGRMEDSDYIRVYYKLNGGPETPLTNGSINGSAASPVTAFKNGLSGNTIQFVARMLNTYEDERHVLDNVMVRPSAAQYLLWYENFDNLAHGVTMHAGQAGWNRDLQGADVSGYFKVADHRYEAHNVNSEVRWVTEYINIKNYQNVSIQVDLASAGVLESSDYMNVYYRVDDGTAIELQDADHTGNFSPVTATASGISGERLQIIAVFRNGADGEKYSIDNVYVTAESFVVPDAEDRVWHEAFDDLPDHTTGDTGSSGWTTDTSATSMGGNGYFEVRQNRLLGRDLNGEAVWMSDVIDISSEQSVNISADIYGYGLLENDDYIKIYYKLDGGTETLLTDGELDGIAASPVTAYANSLSGSSLQFVARMCNTSENEHHVLDNITVESNGAATEFDLTATGGEISCNNNSITLNAMASAGGASYQWTGPGGFSSALQNPTVGMAGTYTVTATVGSVTKTATAEVTEDIDIPDISVTQLGSLPGVILTASSTVANVTFSWQGFSPGQNPIAVSAAGFYSVTAKDNSNGCTAQTTVEVN